MDSVEPLVTAKEYVLSNGTRVVSDTAINFYTSGEILKIEVAGAVAVISVLMLTWAFYKWYNAKAEYWTRQQELEARINAGEMVDPEEIPVPEGFDRRVLLAFGGLICVAGLIIYIIPA